MIVVFVNLWSAGQLINCHLKLKNSLCGLKIIYIIPEDGLICQKLEKARNMEEAESMLTVEAGPISILS